MLPRRSRLARPDFSAALRGSRRFASPHFLAAVPRGVRGYAVVVSKKVSRLSVRRHLIKRRVLAVLRHFPLPPALILFPKSEALALSPSELRDELGALLSKIQDTK